MTNIQVLNLNNVLLHFKDIKVPFSLVIAKNMKKVEAVIAKMDEERIEVINKFAVVDENGQLLGKMQEDGKRIEKPQTINDIEVEDMDGLMVALREIDNKETGFEPEKIDITKSYYDSELKEKATIEDFINTNIEASVINLMVENKLIEL